MKSEEIIQQVEAADAAGAKTRSRWRWRRWVAAVVTTTIVLWLGLTFAVTWSLTHRRRPMRTEIAPPAELAIRNVELATRDGQRLGAWEIAGETGKPAFVLLHGLGGSRRNFLPLIARLRKDGCTVLAVTLRGHGDSTGDTIDFGYSSRADVVAAVEHLRASTAAGTRIIVCGTSLGAGAAMFAAEELGTRVHGYLLESPFKDLETATRNRLEMRMPQALSAIVYPGLFMWGRLLLPIDPSRISPCEAIAAAPISVPVIILSAVNDRYATIQEANAIRAAVSSHGKVIEFPGGGHARLFAKDPERYYRAVRSLIER